MTGPKPISMEEGYQLSADKDSYLRNFKLQSRSKGGYEEIALTDDGEKIAFINGHLYLMVLEY